MAIAPEKKEAMKQYSTVIAQKIGVNLSSLLDVLGISNKELAEDVGFAEGSVSNYISKGRAIPIPVLMKICSSRLLRNKSIYLGIDDFLKDNDLFVREIKRTPLTADSGRAADLKSYAGNYFCYYFDQTRSADDQKDTAYRGMRYGVISVFLDSLSADDTPHYTVGAVFFQQDKKDQAVAVKKEADKLYGESDEKLRSLFLGRKDGYIGEAVSAPDSIFIMISNPTFRDRALMILPVPDKREGSAYRGGVGALNSISHGVHVPVCQKILFSGEVLDCPNEAIGELLSISSRSVSTRQEAAEIAELCKQLYSPEIMRELLISDTDKKAIIADRLDHLVAAYISNNVDSVISVTREDDRAAYKFIKKNASWSGERWQ